MKDNKKNKPTKEIKENKDVKGKKEITKKSKEPKTHKFIDMINKKWLVKGITTVLLVAIIFLVYFGVEFLLDKVQLPEFDMTKGKIYSLSDETKTKIGGIDKDIKITLINYGKNDSVKNIVNRYQALNKKITVDEVDNLESRADLMQKYSLTSSDSLIVVSSGDRETKLSDSDLYTSDYSTEQTVDVTEEAITNAIINVTTETKPKIYLMSDHARYSTDYYSTLITTLKGDANDVSIIDLLSTGKVPEDCNCLIIPTLKDDLTEPEKNYIEAYINNGGNLLLLCGANLDNVKLTNFDEVLDLYGLSLEDGLVLEGKADNMVSNSPNILVEDVKPSSITKNMSMNLKACFPNAVAIKTTTDDSKLSSLGVKYETLITTSDSAFVRTNLNITTGNRVSSDSNAGACTLGVLATKTIQDNKASKLILYSNEAYDQISLGNYVIKAYNNQDIVANSIAYLNARKDTITIRKNYDNVTYTVTQKQNNIIMAIIFLTPVVIIIIGIIIWQVRRRKNK